MHKIAIAALLTAFVAAPAAADTYLGLKAGLANTDFDNKTLTSENRTTFGMFGGYHINKILAAEAEFIGLGKVEFVGGGARSNALSLSVIGLVPVGGVFSLYGKLGVARASTEATSGVRVRRTSGTYGFGGQYDVNPSTALRLSFDHYNLGKPAAFPSGTANVLSLGGMLKF